MTGAESATPPLTPWGFADSARHPNQFQTGDSVPARSLLSTVVDRAGDFTLELLPVHDPVEEPVLQQELARLETLGKFDLDRGLDGTRTRRSR